MNEAKHKAEELVDRFKTIIDIPPVEHDAIQCALICVDEILDTMSRFNNYSELEPEFHMLIFWQQVKKHLLSL